MSKLKPKKIEIKIEIEIGRKKKWRTKGFIQDQDIH